MKETKLSDECQTPQWLFDKLNEEFNFDIDLCANFYNRKCDIWFKDYIRNYFSDSQIDLANKTCFMNPPYSNPKPFIEKAWEDSKHCKIVCLVKCDPSTKWWATFWEYEETTKIIRVNESDFGIGTEEKVIKRKPGPKPGCEVRFFPKRVKFDPPQQLIDSGEVYDIFTPRQLGATAPTYKPKWVHKCKDSSCLEYSKYHELNKCPECRGKGYVELSSPTFPCALIIMDRRDI